MSDFPDLSRIVFLYAWRRDVGWHVPLKSAVHVTVEFLYAWRRDFGWHDIDNWLLWRPR